METNRPALIAEPPATRPRLLSVTDAARQIGVSRSHIYKLRDAGAIKFGKLLGRTVVSQSEIDRFVATVEAGEVA